MFENTLDATKCLNHVGTVIVQIPQFTVVTLVCPVERIVLQQLVLFEIGTDTPALVVRERVSIFLEERIDTRNTTIPRIFQILKRQSAIL